MLERESEDFIGERGERILERGDVRKKIVRRVVFE